MARSTGQKLKLLLLRDYLLKNTDGAHGVTVRQMISHLEGYGIGAERKSLYDDLAALGPDGYGMDIVSSNGSYSLASRDFELEDAVRVLTDEYDVTPDVARRDAEALLADMRKNNLLV